MRGREGGETRGEEGRQGNQSLNLDTNLNRYCPSQSAGLMRQQAANSAAVPKLGDTVCAFPPSLSISPLYFYHLLRSFIYLFLFPAQFCLCFSLLLAVAPQHLPQPFPSSLFSFQVRRVSSLYLSQILSSFNYSVPFFFLKFQLQWTFFRVV